MNLAEAEKTVLGSLRGLLRSQKFQAFAISQVLTAVGIFAAVKWGTDPKTIDTLMELALGKLGIEASVLKAAHAYVDAQTTAAKIQAEAGKPTQTVLADLGRAVVQNAEETAKDAVLATAQGG